MDPPEIPDYYTDLGIGEYATPKEIKKAYANLVLKVHPDKQAPGACGDAHEFRKVQEAYQVLRDVAKRAEYDAKYPEIQSGWDEYRMFLECEAAKAKRKAVRQAKQKAAEEAGRKAAEEAERIAAEELERVAAEEAEQRAAEEAKKQAEEEEANRQWEEVIAMQQSGEEWECQMEAFLEEERRIKMTKAFQWEAIHDQMRKEEIRMEERERAEAFDDIRQQVDADRRNILQPLEQKRQEELQEVERRYKKMIDKEEKKLKKRLDEETATAEKELESKWAMRRQRNEKIKAVRQAKEEYAALQDLHARQKAWEEQQHKAAEERVKEQLRSEEKKRKKRKAEEGPNMEECETEEQRAKERRRAEKRRRVEEEQQRTEWGRSQEKQRIADANKAGSKAQKFFKLKKEKGADRRHAQAAKNGKPKRKKA
ncbi:chaperone protein [Colletotrichum asianum]